MRTLLYILAAPILLAACASTPAGEETPRGVAKYADDPRLGEEVDRICFASSIDSFGNNTRDTLTVREGRDHYLIEVMGVCTNLDDAMRIGLDSTGSCLRDMDAIIVSTQIMGGRDGSPFDTQRCTVKSIHKWNPDAEKADVEESSSAPQED
ncbi:DUF6491 family protein [Hyphomonas pacifica]|uniref:Lipoprotein n=1 Tax=Hyphomonas pacifica TaxID=1280941 RepID=A0A8B2PVN3_9PROT|nr:DUF6491 family protein [Hyphomonas pacifica]RAN34290.1 hypothetical protein HY3_01400 [Hyphomonas pacifica]